MLKSSTASQESRPLWGRGPLSPIYSFFHPVSRQEIQRVIEESKAERAKADATIAKADRTIAKAEKTIAKADATLDKTDARIAELAKSKQEAVKVIADTRDFLQRVQEFQKCLEHGEDISPPAPSASL